MESRTNIKSWDSYFLSVCKVIGDYSKCFSRQIGAIIVRDRSIIATGFNGPPRGIPHCGEERLRCNHDLVEKLGLGLPPFGEVANTSCPRKLLGYKSGEGLEWCPASHAERNCISNAAKNGVITDKTSMYMNCCVPCGSCLGTIIGAGIKEIIVTDKECYDMAGKYILRYSDIKVRRYEE